MLIYIYSKLLNFESSLNNLSTEVDMIGEEQVDLKSQLKTNSENTQKLYADFFGIDRKRSDLRNQIQSLSTRIKANSPISEPASFSVSLQHRITELEYASHTRDLIISGNAEVLNEDLRLVISSLMKVLRVSCDASTNFSEVHRIGQTQASNKPRPIFLRLSSTALRHEVIESKKGTETLSASCLNFSFGNDQVYVNEFYTAEFANLLSKTKKAGRERNYKFVWFRKGYIIVKKNEYSNDVLHIRLERRFM